MWYIAPWRVRYDRSQCETGEPVLLMGAVSCRVFQRVGCQNEGYGWDTVRWFNPFSLWDNRYPGRTRVINGQYVYWLCTHWGSMGGMYVPTLWCDGRPWELWLTWCTRLSQEPLCGQFIFSEPPRQVWQFEPRIYIPLSPMVAVTIWNLEQLVLECMRKDTVLLFLRCTIIIAYGFSRMFFWCVRRLPKSNTGTPNYCI